MQELECSLCNKKIYAGLGNGCKMCGVALEQNEKFCSEVCEVEFKKINHNR